MKNQKFTGDSEMRRAFEIEYGQNWTDPDWRRETGIWASAWHKATAAAQQGVQPIAWAAVYFGGKRAGKIYTTLETEQQCLDYIAQVHRSDDSITLTAKPVYTHPTPQGLDARVQDRLDRLYLALEVCSAELFAQCADQGRAMKYVDQARSALAAEQCARAAQAKQGGSANG